MDNSIRDTMAERSVLGAVIMDNKILDGLDLEVSDFYAEANKVIYSAANTLYLSGSTVDMVTLQDELSKQGKLDAVGGITYLMGLTSSAALGYQIAEHSKIVKTKSKLRQLEKLAQETIALCHSGADPDDVLTRLQSTNIEGVNQKKIDNIEEVFQSNTFEMQEKLDNPYAGVPTEFSVIDKILGGLQKGKLYVLAARPGMGKTTLALNIATNVAIKQGLGVLMFSLEMSSGELVNRVVASLEGIPGQHLNLPKELTESEWQKYWNACSRVEGKHLDIYDNSCVKPSTVHKVIRGYKVKNQLDLVVIDYLQLMDSDGNYRGNKVQEVGEVTKALKRYAREFDVPIILLSQLSRGVESRNDKRPMLSDLRDSGSIEQDADVVMFLYREGYYNQGCECPEATELIVSKHRGGPVGTARLIFKGATTVFYSMADD